MPHGPASLRPSNRELKQSSTVCAVSCRRSTVGLVLASTCALLPGCKNDSWLLGKWLHVDENGKVGMCHEFGKAQRLSIYRNESCSGEPDALLSGKWQLKQKQRVAVQRGRDEIAHLALITEHAADRFVSRGALEGTFFRIGATGATALVAQLNKQSVIKLRPWSQAGGCRYLGRSTDAIRQLPVEKEPRMLRARDQGLEYRVDKNTGDPTIEKVVYALNQDQVDWVAFHLSPAGFDGPGPTGRLESQLGSPVGSLTTGTGKARQNITMWRTYCADLRGAYNKDVDVTLFSTAGKQEALYYASEGVVSTIWQELEQTIEEAAEAEREQPQPANDKTPPKANTTPGPASAAPPPAAARPKEAASVAAPSATVEAQPAAKQQRPTRKPRSGDQSASQPKRKASAQPSPTGRPTMPGDEDI